jgi:hypothetical protein
MTDETLLKVVGTVVVFIWLLAFAVWSHRKDADR